MTYNVMITLPVQITWTSLMPHVTANGAQMTFHIKAWVGEDLVFMLLSLEVYATKTYFPQYHICVKTLYGIS